MMVRQSLLLLFSQFVSTVVVELVSLVVLARLITPEEMGFFAIGLAVFLFLQFLCNFGLREYLIQVDTVSRSMRESLLGLSWSIAAASACALLAGAVFAPEAWLQADVRAVVMILTAAVAIHPFSALPIALLHRAMRFGAMYVAKMAASLAFAFVAIALAWLGFGASSMAWGLVASTLAFAIVVGLFTAFAFFVVPSRRGWLEIFHYARTLAVTTGIHQVAESSIAILIGQLMSYSALGLFSRASDILKKFDRVVIEVVVPVMLPFLTRRVREGESLKVAYLAKTAYLSAICWPAAGFLLLFADPIVLVLLGDQWVGVIALVRVLAMGVVVMPFYATAWSFVVALRLQRRYLPVVLLVNGLRVSVVVGFSFVSLAMVCLGLVAASATHAVLIHRLLKPHLDLRTGVIVDAVKASGVATLLGLVPAVVLSFSLTGSLMHDVLATLCAGVLMVPLWLLGIWRWRHPLKEEILAALSVVRRMGEATP